MSEERNELTKDLNLTEIRVLEVVVDDKIVHDDEISTILGITKKEVRRIKSMPAFKNALNALVLDSLTSAIPTVTKKFIDDVSTGRASVPAYRLFFEIATDFLKTQKKAQDERDAEGKKRMGPEEYAAAQRELDKQIKELAKTGKAIQFPEAANG